VEPEPPLPPELWGHWVHSFEEDTATSKVYRPRSYEFPLARGREAFELRSNGEYIRYNIARRDGNVAMQGSWKRVGPAALEVVVTRDGPLQVGQGRLRSAGATLEHPERDVDGR